MRAFEIAWDATPEHVVFQAGGPIPVDDLGDGWFRVHDAQQWTIFTSPDDSAVPARAIVREDGAVRVRGTDLVQSDDGTTVRILCRR